ncbi:MAG: hypothetical protein JNG88_07890 [Phycisphaerales bacterium]|nr:hypothetical protein [Phycisphaerales bacterium]
MTAGFQFEATARVASGGYAIRRRARMAGCDRVLQLRGGRDDLVFAELLRLDVERQAQAVGDQVQGDVPVIVLNAFAIRGRQRALQASGTVAVKRSMRFVAVKHGQHEPVLRRFERFAALQMGIDLVLHAPQIVRLDPDANASDRIGRGQRAAQPAEPEAARARLGQGVQAANLLATEQPAPNVGKIRVRRAKSNPGCGIAGARIAIVGPVSRL